MATTGNNHNSNNQPRRKRNKKPVKRYSEEYNNRPNPYTGYSADGNYHPEAKKRTMNESPSPRSRTPEEERAAAINAAMAEAAWGPSASKTQQPVQQSPQPAAQQGFVPPTVTMPAPKWAVSNNLTRQQIAAQEPEQHVSSPYSSGDTPSEGENGGGNAQESQTSSSRRGGSHRRKNHRSKDEAARERAAKTEAKRVAVDKIAHGVAAHSVSEQMIDEISSMSGVFDNAPEPTKAPAETGVNWEEFYDAAFPPKAEESSKFASKKSKQPKKRIDFKEETPADAPMIVKPVMLGDDDLLPYDKIAKENEMEKEEAKAAGKANSDKTAAEEVPSKTVGEKSGAGGTKSAKVPDSLDNLLPELDIPEDADDELEDIADIVGTISIEEILASVEKQKHAAQSVQHAQHVIQQSEAAVKNSEIDMDSGFSFDAGTDDSWNEVIPPRAETTPETDVQPPEAEVSPLMERLSQSQDEQEEPPVGYDDLHIEMVDINQFLAATKVVPDEDNGEVPEDVTQDEEISVEFVPEIIVDSSRLEEETPEEVIGQPLPTEETTEPEPEPEQTQPEEPEWAGSEEPAENQPAEPLLPAPEETAEPTLPEEEEAEPAPSAVFTEEDISQPEVEVIIADLEDDIFAEETIVRPEGVLQDESEQDEGIDIEDKIEKIAEAAEVAEVFRIESEDMLPEDEQQPDRSDIFNVSIDDVTVTPETKDTEEEEVKQYRPHAKPAAQADENVFESVLIVDENPRMIDAAAEAGQDETLYLHSKEPSENPTAVFKLPEGPIVFPTDIDDAEFQEQWLDEDEDGDDMASRNKRTRRRISAFIGAVALLFAVMILFSAVKTVVSGFTSIGSSSEKKTEYTEFISPVVVNDPMPFESVEKADNNLLLKSSIWQALKELDETEGYEHVSDATNKIVLPADMVEKAAKELFGKDVKINMNVLSEYDGSAIYYYDSIDNSFHITRSGITGPSAVITKIAQKSDYISLIVGYLSQEEMSLTSSESNEEECYKFMEYVLALNSDGSYYIKSIRNYVDD